MGDVSVVRFSDDCDNRCVRRDQRLQIRVRVSTAAGFSRRAKGSQTGVLEVHLGHAGKELDVLRVRPGVTAFDVVNAELVHAAGDLQLVIDGERDTFHLRTVAKGRVVQLDAVFHGEFKCSGR